jgi:signal peptidase I
MLKTGCAMSLMKGLTAVLMAAIWILFAPTAFGGTANYVIVAGASMQPELQQGDLVITRRAAHYAIGDVAAYQHPQVGPVIHRVIDRHGPYYTFQGDNNGWLDSYEPTAAEIMGKAWLHVHGGAELLIWLRTPLGRSLLSLAAGSMFLLIVLGGSQHRKKQRKRGGNMFLRWYRQIQSLRPMEWVFPLSILLFAAVLLGLFGFTRPRFESIPMDLAFTHQGNFSYAGVGSPAVYEQGQIASGEAVFHALVDKLDLELTYTIDSNSPMDVSGTYSVNVRISEPNGWQRVIELQPVTAFQGASFHMAATLDIDQITGVVQRLRDRTGLSRQTFNVDVNVPITVSGTLDSLPLADNFTASLPFVMDEIELYPASSDSLEGAQDPLSFLSTSYLSRIETLPNTLNILGISLTVDQSRIIAMVTGAVSLALLVLIGAPAAVISRERPAEGIKLNHADRLIDVTEIPYEAGYGWVNVSSFEDLLKLSETSGTLIMHHLKEDQHIYVVEQGGTGYRFILHQAVNPADETGPAAGSEDER